MKRVHPKAHHVIKALVIGLLLLVVSAATASDVMQRLPDGFPDRPITIWASVGPGHVDDIMNTQIAEIASEYSPVRIITANYPEAGPSYHHGTVQFLRFQPGGLEGYHLIGGTVFGSTIRWMTRPELVNRGLFEVVPINLMEIAPAAFIVHRTSEFQTLQDVEAWARANPGRLSVVASSPGGGMHTTSLAWADQAGIDFRFIPTEAANESQLTLLGRGAQIGVLAFGFGLHEDLRIIAVTGAERPVGHPDLPAVAEFGYSIPSGGFQGMQAPAEVSQERLEWFYELFRRVVDDPRYASRRPGQVVYEDAAYTRNLQEEIVRVFLPILQELGLASR